MIDYLKKHAAQADYTTWAASANYVTPNVSLIDATGAVTYNPVQNANQEDTEE